MSGIYTTDLFHTSIPLLKIVAKLVCQDLPITHISKGPALVYVHNSTVLTEPISICYYLIEKSQQCKLLGSSFEAEIEVYSFIEYLNTELVPLVTQINGQIFGKVPANSEKYQYAVEEVKRVVKVLDDKLKLRTFFVGDSMTLADLFCASQLDSLFKLVLTSEIRKKCVNLSRWFSQVRNMWPVVGCLGKMFLCENGFKVDFGEAEAAKKIEEKLEQKATKAKKHTEKEAKEAKTEEVKEKEKTEQKTEASEGFNLDNFKRAFQNTEDKSTVIQTLIDLPDGWSVWKIDYSKDVTEGKVDYLTCNLAKGTLQRLDGLRKTGFGSWGVYCNEQTKEYEIRGVMMWKGNDVAAAWKEHPSHEYHIFKKLDTKNPENMSLIKDYWLEAEKTEGLSLHASYRLI